MGPGAKCTEPDKATAGVFPPVKGPTKLTRFLRFVLLSNSNWLVPRIYKFESSWFTLLRIAIVNFRWQYWESRNSREWPQRNFSTSNLLSSSFPVSSSYSVFNLFSFLALHVVWLRFFVCVVELKKQICCSFQLSNKTETYVAFKVISLVF